MKGLRMLTTLVLMVMIVPLAYGAPVFGDIHGVIRNSEGLPVPGAEVIAHSVNGNFDRTVVCGTDGFFLVETLEPGQYQLRVSKEGYESSKGTTVELAQQKSVAVDMTLVSAHPGKASRHSSLTAASALPNRDLINNGTPSASATVATDLHAQPATENLGNAPLTEREQTLLDRIDRLEQRLAALEAKGAKEPTQTSASAQPALVASLRRAADLPPEEKPNALSITQVPGTPAYANTTPGTEPSVASLSPAGALPPAKVLSPAQPQGQAPGPAQQPQPGGKSSIPEPAQTIAPPTHILPEALEAPEPTSGVDNVTPFAYGRLYLDERDSAQQRHCAGHEVLHPGGAIRHAFHGRLQSTEGPHDGRRHGVVPVRRISVGAGQRGW